MATFFLKKDDLLPQLRAVLRSPDGLPVDLTNASSVTFSMLDGAGVAKINAAAATVVDAVRGIVQYAWTGTDTDTAGSYHGEFVATFPGGLTITYPNFRAFEIKISPRGG